MADQPQTLHILMFPWLAMGHITPYLHLSNKLAERGHRISFLLPPKAQLLLHPLNLHPSLISFLPLTVPPVSGLPPDTQTASDIPLSLTSLLATALDLTRPAVDRIIRSLRPDFVFYDTAHWIPEITSNLKIKSVSYNVICAASFAFTVVPARSPYYAPGQTPPTAEQLATPPTGYPSSAVVLRPHETRKLKFIAAEFGTGTTFYDRVSASLKSGDAIAFRTCSEIEGPFCDYLSREFNKPLLLTGPVLPSQTSAAGDLDPKWESWLRSHEPGSVIYCSFGSQFELEKRQFQEILLAFELTGYPFFAALKPPAGCGSVEEAMPEGFRERVEGKGVVYGGWVQQPEILRHPAVGCFVSHCGFGSMWEALMGKAQIVLVPELGDQVMNARIMAAEMGVAVEVEREEGGWVGREELRRAVKEVMEEGGEVRERHGEWRKVLGKEGFMSGYIDRFVEELRRLLD